MVHRRSTIGSYFSRSSSRSIFLVAARCCDYLVHCTTREVHATLHRRHYTNETGRRQRVQAVAVKLPTSPVGSPPIPPRLRQELYHQHRRPVVSAGYGLSCQGRRGKCHQRLVRARPPVQVMENTCVYLGSGGWVGWRWPSHCSMCIQGYSTREREGLITLGDPTTLSRLRLFGGEPSTRNIGRRACFRLMSHHLLESI